jgi:Methyltransferase domain
MRWFPFRVNRPSDATSEPSRQPFAPPGHFYSPICDPAELRSSRERIWPNPPSNESAGVDFNLPEQFDRLSHFARYTADIDFPVDPPADPTRYFYGNDQFPCMDAEVLFCFLRHLRPKQMIEIGSGFSTLVAAEVNRRFLGSKMRLTCVEPFPRQFLIDGISGVTDLVRQGVQQLDFAKFESLDHDDILFVDSSHVSRTGSDVNHLVFEIFPRLKPGVYVHIHDIFLPDDYPVKWAIDDGRNWNEQYVIRAFLQYNTEFQVVWASYLMATRHPAKTAEVFRRFPSLGAGGSLWIRRRT